MNESLKELKQKYCMYCELTNDLLKHTKQFYDNGNTDDINSLTEFFTSEKFKECFLKLTNNFNLIYENIRSCNERIN